MSKLEKEMVATHHIALQNIGTTNDQAKAQDYRLKIMLKVLKNINIKRADQPNLNKLDW